MKHVIGWMRTVETYERKKAIERQKLEEENLKARRSRNLTTSIKLLFKNRNGSTKV